MGVVPDPVMRLHIAIESCRAVGVRSPRHLTLAWLHLLLALWAGGFSESAHGASPFAGAYSGPVHFRTSGPFATPEMVVGTVYLTVDAEGGIRDLSGDLTGTVDAAGTIAWRVPNPFFFVTGQIEDNAVRSQGESRQGEVTVHTRIAAASVAGAPGDSLAGQITQLNPRRALGGMSRVRRIGDRFVAVGDAGAVAVSGDGLEWNRFGVNTSLRLNGVAEGNGVWVAVGNEHTRFRSLDGVNWVALPKPLMTPDLLGVAHGNGAFVAVTSLGMVQRSTDGLAWTDVGTPLPSGSYANVDFVNGRFVLWRNSQVAFSDDGSAWSAPVTHPAGAPSGSAVAAQLVAHGSGRYVVGGSSGLAYSEDGRSWTRVAAPVEMIRWVAHGLGAFHARDARHDLWRSTDGIQWVRVQSFPSLASPDSAVFTDTLGVAVGPVLYTTRDGVVWELPEDDWTAPNIRNVGFTSSANPQAVVQTDFSAGRFYAGANVGTVGPLGLRAGNGFLASPNSPTFWLGDSGFAQVYHNGLQSVVPVLTDRSLRTGVDRMLAGDGGAMIHYQLPTTVGGPFSYEWVPGVTEEDLLSGASRPSSPSASVLVGSGGVILRSTDLQRRNWSVVASGTTQTLRQVHYHAGLGGLFIAVGDGGTILTSADGAAWTVRKSGTTRRLVGVQELLVAAEDGTLLSSADAVAWTVLGRLPAAQKLVGMRGGSAYGERGLLIDVSVGTGGGAAHRVNKLPGSAGSFTAGTHGNGRFVLVGTEGAAVSTDGRQWTARPSGLALQDLVFQGAVFRAVAFGNGRFVAVGDQGRVGVSNDGLTWQTLQAGPANRTLRAVAFGNGRFAAAGDQGVVLVSSDGLNWTDKSVGGTRQVTALAWSDGRFVGAGTGYLHSPDNGDTWTTGGMSGSPYHGMAAGAGRFVAVGDGGSISVTTNGVNWTVTTVSPPDAGVSRSPLDSVVYVNGEFRVSTAGALLVSPDATPGSWRRLPTGIPVRTPAAVAANGLLLLGGGNEIHGMLVPDVDAPVLVGQPWDRTVEDGATLTLSVSAVGEGPLTHQWLFNGVAMVDGGRISGATTPTLTVNGVRVVDAGRYQCVVAGPKGSRASREAVVTVVGGPVFTVHPSDTAVLLGGETRFRAEATSPDPIRWRWWHDGAPLAEGPGIRGVTGPELVLSGVTAAQEGEYWVVAASAAGARTSHSARLVVNRPAILVTPPVAGTAFAGGVARFSVEASGSEPLTYVWRRNGAAISGADPRFTGFNGPTLLLRDPVSDDASATYSVVVSNAFGTATSPEVALYLVAPGMFRPDFVFESDSPAGSGTVRVNAILPDGEGRFVAFGNVRAGRITGGYLPELVFRFHPDGALDRTFVPIPSSGSGRIVHTAVPAHQGGFIVAGILNMAGTAAGGGVVTVGQIGRLRPDLTLDTGFNGPTAFNYSPRSMARLSGRRYLVGRSNSGIGGENELLYLTEAGVQERLVRNTTSASRGELYSLVALPDETVWYAVATGLRRRLPDQTETRLWTPSSSDPVPSAVIAGPGGEVYHNRQGRLIRVRADGAVDEGFLCVVEGVRAIAFPGDGTLVIGGSFSQVNGVSMRSLAHVRDDGSLVAGFRSPYEGAQDNVHPPVVYCLHAMEDGSVLAGSNIRLAAGRVPGRQDFIQRIQVGLPGGEPDPGTGFATWLREFNLPDGQDGPEDDPDGDGITNRLEHALGGNPMLAAPAEWPRGVPSEVGGTMYPAVRFTRNTRATGVRIEVLASTTLSFGVALPVVESVEDLGNGIERVTVRAAQPVGASREVFFQVRVATP